MTATLKVLALGDVVGEPGRRAIKEIVPALIREEELSFVIANGENLAGGSGITESTVLDLFSSGVDVITSGDHIFRKKEGEDLLEKSRRILKPANYPAGTPGIGSTVVNSKDGGRKIGVLNLIGRVFLKTVNCPFEVAKREVEKLRQETPIIFVDIHAEATSEKVALGWYLDGQITAIFGTHTHVQTADETVLPQGTGYITELGMCGPYKSVIGREIDQVLRMFLTQMPTKLDVAKEDARISGALFEVDAQTGKTLSVRRIHERISSRTKTGATRW
ncbi:MAG: TIGR00282 family metallophosphoesterase [Candidatus Omnitrophica bacterium]|nr:TIGR00282 family metallophosphoesterase [Candidatus Omnitrophota bacterium]